MFSNIRNIFHLLVILRKLAKYDALFFMRKSNNNRSISYFAYIVIIFIFTPLSSFSRQKHKNLSEGQRLALALQNLGPTFIKFGQALSMRGDVIGDDIATELATLRDRLPAFASEIAVAKIERDFGCKLEEKFQKFDIEPIAAASIAQVHFATDINGNELVVKVKRPDVEQRFSNDIEIMRFATRIVDNFLPKFKRMKLQEVVESFAKTVAVEMDFMLEAAAASELAENFANDDDVRIPKIYWSLVSKDILTLERFHGTRIDNPQSLIEAGHQPNEIIRKSARIFIKQALRDGFFHADMHPGNLIVDDAGKVCIFDFGIMGRVDIETRLYLAQMLVAFLEKDYYKVAKIHYDLGFLNQSHDLHLFAQACRSIAEPIFNLPQNQISISRLLEQMLRITGNFQIETQPQLILFQKTLMMAEGMGRIINPNANYWNITRDIIEEWGRENLGVKATIESKVRETTNDIKKSLSALAKLDQLITKDGLKLHTDNKQKNCNPCLYYKLTIALVITAFVLLRYTNF